MPGRGRPFGEGNKGNPAGRPKGARNRTTLALEAILEGEAEAITRKAIELAQDGDTVALRLCMDRLIAADGHVLFNGTLHAIDDTGALAKARDWAKDYSVDVWDGLRFVGLVDAAMPALAEAQGSSA